MNRRIRSSEPRAFSADDSEAAIALWIWALAPVLGRRALFAAAAISFLYAVSDEYHQSFVPGRDSDPFDVLVDSLGIATAVAAALAASARRAVADSPLTDSGRSRHRDAWLNAYRLRRARSRRTARRVRAPLP